MPADHDRPPPAAGGPDAGRPDDSRPLLPEVSRDETGEGWGERPDSDRDDDFYLCERPPHHLD